MDSGYRITMKQAEEEMACYRKVFSIVRLLDEEALQNLANERKEEEAENSSDEDENILKGHMCQGCVAMEAFSQKKELSCRLQGTKRGLSTIYT